MEEHFCVQQFNELVSLEALFEKLSALLTVRWGGKPASRTAVSIALAEGLRTTSGVFESSLSSPKRWGFIVSKQMMRWKHSSSMPNLCSARFACCLSEFVNSCDITRMKSIRRLVYATERLAEFQVKLESLRSWAG